MSGLKWRFTQAFRSSSSSLSARLSSLSPFTGKTSANAQTAGVVGRGGSNAPPGGVKKKFDWGGGGAKRRQSSSSSLHTTFIQHAVLYESINLVSHLQSAADEEIKHAAAALLCSFIEDGNPNFRYKSLGLIASMAEDRDVKSILKNSLPAILKLLHEDDISLRRQAVCLSYALSGEDNWSFIVSSLLACLERDEEEKEEKNRSLSHDVFDAALQEQTITQIIALVQAYSPDPPTWLLDVTFKILYICPYVRDETWVNAIQCVGGVSGMDHKDSSNSSSQDEKSRSDKDQTDKPNTELQ
ncbi:adaptin n terminal region domain-containing protein, partial [Cystoisospora suis]